MSEAVAVDRLERMSAQWECEQLIRRYAYLNDYGEYEALAGLFAEDGMLSRSDSGGKPVVGRQAILDFFRARPNRLSRHLVNNIVINLETERTARGACYVILYATIATEGTKGKIPRAERRVIGCCDDRFVKTPDGWRFAERKLTLTMTT
jgi:hypothetical protein